jgi:glycolate oxidase FAD binding subunit
LKGRRRLTPHMDLSSNLSDAPTGVGQLETLGVQVRRIERPDTEKEAQRILAQALKEKWTVFPCGGGTSLAVGMLPETVDIALVTTGMNRVLAFDPRNLNMAVSAGMTLDQINQFLAGQENGFFLPLDPPHSHRATIGGAYAANSSGPLRLRYGTLRDQVLGVRVADSQGREVGFGGKTVKNVSGYDLTKFFIGSAGSLCLITSISLRVYPLPESSSLCDLIFGTLEELERFLGALRSSVLIPSAVVVTGLAGGPGVSDTVGMRFRVMIGFEGLNPAVERQNRDLLKMADEFGGMGGARAGRDMMVRGIRSAVDPDKFLEDPLFLKISVPIVQGPRIFAAIHKAAQQSGLPLKGVLSAADGVMFIYTGGIYQENIAVFVEEIKDLVSEGRGYLTPLLAHRLFLQSWGARVEPALHRLVLQPIKERLDPTRVFPPIV